MNPTSYPTDLTDAQWEKLLPYLPKPSPLGRPHQVGDALNYQCYFLSRQVRVSVANATSSDATVANGLFPFQKVESRWHMAYDSSSPS